MIAKDSAKVSGKAKRSAARWTLATAVAVVTSSAAAQGLSINEVFFNQPGQRNNPGGAPFSAPDSTHAYVELRGVPFQTLENAFLVFLENEGQLDPRPGLDAGTIELFFDLDGVTLGANGFLTLRQKTGANPQYNDYVVNPKATDLKNAGETAGPGFGSAENSSIGAFSVNSAAGTATGEFEGSGFTALLIQTDGQEASRPQLGVDLDADNAGGFDVPGGNAGWTILDSIAVFGERPEAEFGRTYAPLTFGFDSPTLVQPWLQPGNVYVQLLPWPSGEREAEYIARWGNSTGHAAEDWHVSNVTDRTPESGFQNMGDFRQSADPHGSSEPGQVQSSRLVPYGTPLTTTLGAPNYPLNLLTPVAGDFDGDLDVDAVDHDWQWLPRFAGGDLEGSDILQWQRALGAVQNPLPPAPSAGTAVPEPVLGAWLATAMVCQGRRRRGRRA